MSRPAICPYCDYVIETTSGFAAGTGVTCPGCAEQIDSSMVAGQTAEWVAERIAQEEAKQRHRRRTATAADSRKAAGDTITGLNLRWKDNVFQAVVILIHMVMAVSLTILIGETDWVLPAAFLGLVIGVFTSGIFLMIYRLRRQD